jgi:CubicO group peptidase (beta-lactamase class C family)
VLGEVIRRLDGRPFGRYVREEVFEPLGLHDSWVGMPRERYLFYKATGRIAALWMSEGSEGPEMKDHGWDSEARCVRPNPGGNGYGPVRELGRFYEMLLARGTGNGNRILSPQAVEAMTARHRTGMMDLTFKHVLDWGLGFIVNSAWYGAETVPYGYGRHASPRTFGHSGYRSSVGFADPEWGLAVALAFNGTPSNERHEVRVRSVLDAIYEDLGLAI